MKWQGLIHKYREYLPIGENTNIISLCEGNTPLIRARNIEKEMEGLEIYLKYDGLNPTGSFKDRGMTMAVTKAVEEGSKAIICASTGNTSAAAAAFAAKAGIKSIVIIPNKKIAMGKLAQAIAYGAQIIAIDGNFDDALNMVKEISKKHPITLVNSVNPYRIEGQKTAAFEVCDQLEEAPDYLSIPVGNAGNITAYWKGFKEYKEHEKINKLPQLLGFQAEGAAPIVENKVFENPETIATAIRIGNPASWEKAVAALEESNGAINKISDEEILKAYGILASKEGIFAEPASCISIAGIYKLYKEGKLKKGKVVCVLTGNGLKDPDIAVNMGGNIKEIKADFDLVEKEIIG
ncbi:threonine synthase [Inediibacterium massiliense]|uniref:threonine synthase n=1 Tax=Inediibacterium massiliense TaxID=1658111 RepID=UPI0006B558E6|nr:threonine synthase [Inediibacterium massiliense]